MGKFKKVMPIVMSAVLATGILSGCSTKKEEPTIAQKATTEPTTEKSAETEKEKETVARPEEMTIAKVLYFGDAGQALDLKEEWPKVMEEKYGIKFNIISPPRNNYMEKINLMITSGELTGLVNLFSPEDVKVYMNDGVIEPLDEYLKENETWNSLPEEMRDMYKFNDQIWAIPTGLTPNTFTRSIRKDWLDNLGLEVPTTVDEFYEVCKAFTFNDPDGNGQNDTVGLTSSGTWNLQDIFQAFGARLDHVGEGSIVWDPQLECFNDSMLNPEMVDALTYLNKMYKEGILDNELFTNKGSNMRDKIIAGKAGGAHYWLMYGKSFELGAQKNIPEAKFVEIAALTGKLTTKLNQVTFSNAPYVLLKGTKQPKEVVNAFVDIFFGDVEGHFMGELGIPDKNYTIEGKQITTKLDDQGMPIPGASIVVGFPGMSENEYSRQQENMTPEQVTMLQADLDLKNELLYGSIEKGLYYELSNNLSTPTSETFYNIRADIQRCFSEAIVKAVTGEIPVEQALAGYREQMKRLGAQKILDEANEAIGATGVNQY